jgi:hypothetical protein
MVIVPFGVIVPPPPDEAVMVQALAVAGNTKRRMKRIRYLLNIEASLSAVGLRV